MNEFNKDLESATSVSTGNKEVLAGTCRWPDRYQACLDAKNPPNTGDPVKCAKLYC